MQASDQLRHLVATFRLEVGDEVLISSSFTFELSMKGLESLLMLLTFATKGVFCRFKARLKNCDL